MNDTVISEAEAKSISLRDDVILNDRLISIQAKGIYAWLHAMGLLKKINHPAIDKAMKYEFGMIPKDSAAWQGLFELMDRDIIPK